MLKSFVYMKNYRRIMMVFTVFLLYLSMYLIHNTVGSLCIIKTGDDNKANEGDIEASRLLYKVNNSNLFAVCNAKHFFLLLLSFIAANMLLPLPLPVSAFALLLHYRNGVCCAREHDHFE